MNIMTMRTHRAPLALTLAALLILSACGASQVITDLELAVDAAAVALPLIGPSAGLPPALQAQIQGYLTATSMACGQAADILAGPGTDAAKGAEIAAVFAGIAVPAVPAQYQGIASAVQQVAVLVAKFLGGLPVASTQPLAVRAPGSRPAVPGNVTKLSDSDRAKLASIKEKVLTMTRK